MPGSAKAGAANGPNGVALAPQLVAAQAGALAAELAGSPASVGSLDFYRIPAFLLPIYQSAAVQYGVPWQILAAINEVETDYGSDLSVSSAGAVGWMQFMPSTWLQYGVDALDSGSADPYNPVDAIFAAARYLRAAGATTDLRAAILAYNHSGAYLESVLLRAKLISAYPDLAIGTLTSLIDDGTPVAGAQLGLGIGDGRLLFERDGRRHGAAPRRCARSVSERSGGRGERRDAQRLAHATPDRSSQRSQGVGGRGAGRTDRRGWQLAHARTLRRASRSLRRHVHLRGPCEHRTRRAPGSVSDDEHRQGTAVSAPR